MVESTTYHVRKLESIERKVTRNMVFDKVVVLYDEMKCPVQLCCDREKILFDDKQKSIK